MNLQEAKSIADAIITKLSPYCEIINIAGSIRREKIEVGDIEIVALPKHEKKSETVGLFQERTDYEVVSPEFTTMVATLGKIISGRTTGRYMKIDLPEGISLDLFMPAKTDYYRQYAIRTGNSDYSHKLIAAGWLRKGWCGTSDGLRLVSESQRNNDKWVCLATNPTKPPVWQSEKEFFDFIEVQYLEPSKRKIIMHDLDEE